MRCKVEGAVKRTKVEEVWYTMNPMKLRKASRPSGVAIELFKAGGDKCLKSLTNDMISCLKISYGRIGC